MSYSSLFGRCILPVAQGRAEARDASELVTQLLYGQGYEVLEEQEKWLKIKIANDGYECWLDRKQHAKCDQTAFEKTKSGHCLCEVIHWQGEGAEKMLLSGGAVSNELGRIATLTEIEALSIQYINAPYLWGGKTILGIDCSGFTQVIYSMLGERLSRDAWQQAEQGETISFVQETQTGDLAFFDNEDGRITHVGIILKKGEEVRIVHASGKVRIDSLDHQGIFVKEDEGYSHKLRIIKRYMK